MYSFVYWVLIALPVPGQVPVILVMIKGDNARKFVKLAVQKEVAVASSPQGVGILWNKGKEGQIIPKDSYKLIIPLLVQHQLV